MSHRSTDPAAPASLAPVAGWRHTVLLIAVLLALAAAGARMQAGASDLATRAPSATRLYLSLLASEWLLLYAVARGVRARGLTIRDLVGGRWQSARDVAADVALGAGCWAAVKLLAAAWTRWLPGVGHAASLAGLLPNGVAEGTLWVALSVSAGFCEEVVFRGYFQRQFGAWTRQAWLGVALQAALFGVSHGYQGIDACLRITAIGAIFGALALWRRSLRPGILAHAWTDVASGLFRL